MAELHPPSPPQPGVTLAAYIATMDQRLSDRSKAEYTGRLRELRAKIDGAGDTLTPGMLLNVIKKIVVEGQAAESTVWTYRSAVMYWLGQQAQAQMAAGSGYGDYASTFEELTALKYSRQAGAPRRGASLKLKHFPDECLAALESYAVERGHRAPTIGRALAFVRANLLVGLRPTEWFHASFMSYFPQHPSGALQRDEGGNLLFEHVLTVENAKATHGRGNGSRRELMLIGVTTEELTALMNFWRIAQEFAGRFPPNTDQKKISDAFYRPINTAIRNALSRAGFGARDIPSVYSTRHQVVADFKASEISSTAITAWFGHSSEATHKKHYGRKRHGGQGVTFRPTPESIAQVAPPSFGRRDYTIVPPQVVRDAEDWVKTQESRRPTSTSPVQR
jgi:integrase